MFLREACQLDQAVVVAACRHVRVVGHMPISMEMLWSRLKDVLKAAKLRLSYDDRNVDGTNTSLNRMTLLLPPYEIFESSVHRLIEVGVFKYSKSRLVSFLSRFAMISLCPDITPVSVALQSSCFAKLFNN